ncbi:hypothetical protein MT418_000304 [Batrachochytrium dendrobatidis]
MSAPVVPPNQYDVNMDNPLQGSPWADIESHPGVFTELASQIGIKGVEIAEIFSLDAEYLKAFEPIYGLIFLFEWHAEDTEQSKIAADIKSIPEKIFFINQVVPDACATQALLSIALNSATIELDSSLVEFKQFCLELSPAMRGLALSGFQRLRVSHNSFARQTDISTLYYPVPQKRKYKKAVTKKPPQSVKGNLARVPVSISTDTSQKSSTGTTLKSRKAQQRKNMTSKTCDSNLEKSQTTCNDKSAQPKYHFIGYVPIDDAVWELDGLKRMPKKLGNIPKNGDSWISIAISIIQKRMNSYSVEFNLLALIEDRVQMYEKKKRLISTARECILKCEASEASPTSDFTVFLKEAELSVEDYAVLKSKLNVSTALEILDKSDRAIDCRIKEEAEKRQEYKDENIRRRFNYAPFIRKWFEIMIRNGSLASHIK